MISRFFIDRPIFAAVISIIITLTGAIAMFSLPVAQYPEITPPTVFLKRSGCDGGVLDNTAAVDGQQVFAALIRS